MEKKHRFYFGKGPEAKPLSLDYCGLLCPNKIKCRTNPSEVKEKCKDVYKGKSVFVDLIPEITHDGKMICTNIRIIGEKEKTNDGRSE